MNLLHPTLIPLAFLVPGLPATAAADANGLFLSHLDNVLGTSFDIKLTAGSYKAARQAESAALTEINRLNAILGSYEATSEFNRFLASAGEAVPVSADLMAVLNGFDHWQKQTGGVINAAAEAINQLWKRAERTQVRPSANERANAVSAVQQPHWVLDQDAQTATRLSQTPLRLHTFAKSYILDRAADKALAVDGVEAVVLNIGGDLVVRGNRTESVAVANPRADAENDAPLARLRINDRAVATSGDYRRGVRVGDSWYSHIVDPRTAEPAREVISATVIHPDAATAGALATAFNVLSPTASAQLAGHHPGTDYLLVTHDGQHLTSPGWNDLLQPVAESTAVSTAEPATARLLSVASVKDKLWDPKQELLISLEVSQIEGRSRRPFVAVWVEDDNHVPVRQIALWYNKPKWLRDLRAWYSLERPADFDMSTIASATRSPGSYSLKWDGKNDKGEYVKQGKYTVCIEAAREHGTYQLIREEMNFNGKTKQQTLAGNVEIASAALDYRKVGSDK
ncbi:DUF2271 domain-containing protein [Fibrella forsythiae]|uniref:FAD:protein FMN transferase n=1 Tax=Fibrella forsythiae TaxID=2817061 RepID=A0ABS3JHA7_9BACT|nr:DUF2271 domain-containing protein [Fibrella forsythiae]MBO0949390.1 DUF2271 domain-containing protein [Fibrella forsythiae]